MPKNEDQLQEALSSGHDPQSAQRRRHSVHETDRQEYPAFAVAEEQALYDAVTGFVRERYRRERRRFGKHAVACHAAAGSMQQPRCRVS